MYVFIHIYIYIYTYIYTYRFIHIILYIHVYTYICIHIALHIYIYTYVCLCVCIYMVAAPSSVAIVWAHNQKQSHIRQHNQTSSRPQHMGQGALPRSPDTRATGQQLGLEEQTDRSAVSDAHVPRLKSMHRQRWTQQLCTGRQMSTRATPKLHKCMYSTIFHHDVPSSNHRLAQKTLASRSKDPAQARRQPYA